MKKGPVRFHTTDVPPSRSLAEVAELLRQYGARRFEQLWTDEGETYAVRFDIAVPEAKSHMAVVLRPKVEALAAVLLERHRIRDAEQVNRVAWRQLKGILEGILMAADSGMFTAPQLFLGMAERQDGEALWDAITDQPGAFGLLAPPVVEAEIL